MSLTTGNWPAVALLFDFFRGRRRASPSKDLEMNAQPTVFLVDPDGPTRDAVKKLAKMMDLHCEEYVSGPEFLDTFDSSQPGCVVMEVRVPGINGLQIQQRLLEQGVTLPVLFLSEDPSVSIAVHTMRAGALHFFEKPFRENDLWTAIQEAIQVDQGRREAKVLQQQLDERIGSLTEKEIAVLEMIAEGRTKRAMALEMGVSVRTIEHHRTQLMRKLETTTPTGLLRFAMSKRNQHPLHGRMPVRHSELQSFKV
jgi:FixJ family two-component response regulator